MERRVTGNCHARCEAGEKREITSNSYLSLYEVRSFVGWFRHMTLVLLVLAMLTVICARERLSFSASESNQTPPLPIPLTVRCASAVCLADSSFLFLAVPEACWTGHGGVDANKGERELLTLNVASTPASCSSCLFF